MKQLLCITILCLGLLAIATGRPDEAVKAEEPLGQRETTEKKSYSQGTVADRSKLVAHLFNNVTYNKFIQPDNLAVEFGLNLIDFHLCEERKALSSQVWLKFKWADSRLAWNPEDFGGVTAISYEADDVWKPDITLYNSADPAHMMSCWHSNVIIKSNGELTWIPPCKLKSTCHKMDLVKEPYGEHNCTLKFGSWTFDGFAMDIQLYKGHSKMDLSELSNTSGFDIVSTNAQLNTMHYSCCPEPYKDITYTMTLKKKLAYIEN